MADRAERARTVSSAPRRAARFHPRRNPLPKALPSLRESPVPLPSLSGSVPAAAWGGPSRQYPHVTDEDTEAQGGQVATQPVSGGSGRQTHSF